MGLHDVYYASPYVRLLFDDLQARGLDARRVLGEPPPPAEGFTVYRGSHWRRLLERASAALDDPALGLHLGQRIRPAHLGALGQALHACRDLGEALLRWQRHEALISNVAPLRVREQDGAVEIAWPDTPEPPGRLVDETALTAVVQFARHLTGQRLAVLGVDFAHPAPADARPYRAFFGGPVRFGRPAPALRLPRAALALPLVAPDEALLQRLAEQARAAMRAMAPPATGAPGTDDGLAERVREAIAAAPPGASADAEAVARALALSPRTLHRRRAAQGLGFRALREQTLQGLAQQHLADPRLTLGEVAWMLGYAEHSAFTRAFRRWTGESPLQWRLRRTLRVVGA